QSELIEIFSKLQTLDPDWLNTLEAFFECGGSLEATARSLHIHVNTVRYRFKGIEQAIGLSPNKARDGYLLQVAISLGRLKQR
ncbi:MAG: PucR family transcriptional regulator, partial [Candidatus Nanopelagicales bacterium]